VASLFLLPMLGAIDLDDEAVGVADEIQEVAAKRGLAAEVKPFAAQATKRDPEAGFRGGVSALRMARARARVAWSVMPPPWRAAWSCLG